MRMLSRYSNMSLNNKIIVKNTIMAFGIRGLALIISFLTTPLFIKYFNNNVILGVWYTLLSVLIWFLNFDLGIGNGIRNNLVKAFAKNDNDLAKKIISSGLFSISCVTLILFIFGILLINIVDLKYVFNIKSELISDKTMYMSALLIFIALIMRFFFSIITSIIYAIQKSAINNFLGLLVSVLQLLFILIFQYENAEKALVSLSVAYLIISNLPVAIAGIVLFLTKLRKCTPSIKYIKKEHIKMIMNVGSVFFLCQVLYMIIISTNELLITRIFGAENTTEYTFYYKLFSLISTIFTLTLTPIWGVVTKALVDRNYIWLRKLYNVMKTVGYVAMVAHFLLIPVLQPVFDMWLKEESIRVNYFTASAFACFGGLLVYNGVLSSFVCGMARMKLQSIFYAIGTVVKIVIVFSLAENIGNWSVVVWGNIAVLAPYCIIQQIDLDIYIRKLKTESTINMSNALLL